MSDKLILSTNETSRWYAVLSVIQASQKCVLPVEVESYLVRLFVYANDSIHKSLSHSLVNDTPTEEWSESELKFFADHCLLVTGFYPEFLIEMNVSVRDIVARGTAAYKQLLSNNTQHEPYAYLADNFDVLTLILLQIHAMNKPALKNYMDGVELEKLGMVNQALQTLSPINSQNICFN